MMRDGNVLKYSIGTKVVHGSKCYDPHTGAVSFPIYQSATFRHPALHQTTGYDYSRLQNPTREELENTIANIENGKFGFAFSSGMAAVSTILSLFTPGDHIVVSDDLYGGTYRLFEEIYKKYGLEFSYVNTSKIQDIENSVKDNTKAFFIETPTNPMMKVADLRAISEFSKDRKILLIVDNTFLTPYFQRPLELGADIVVHSGTKYLGGHNDTLAGLIVVNDEELSEKLKLIQKSEGAVLAPFDSWLILRGIKTLGVRLEKQQQNAMKIAKWLCTHKNVTKVNYVGLPEHEGYEISKSQASGFGAMISFNAKDVETVERVLAKVQLVMFAESLGGVESLITYPTVQTHAAIPEEMRQRIGVTDTLLRLSVGIEEAEDIIADLEQALE
ncbi:trans-sulfuration enzyme family protein [Acetivibrio straminisolvens]|uniref:trans-sulfuration enzyme family protein n=1 Tax=Acetivibrio straminisolvens TaxID=253314 RepID=UPI00223EA851|nr:PLP-dependent aspartate aminotransferase family protein [Acetivibrio straminisolvens]